MLLIKIVFVALAHWCSSVAASKHKNWHWEIAFAPYSSLDLPCVAFRGPLTLAEGNKCTSWGSYDEDYTFSSYDYSWASDINRGHSEEPWSYGLCAFQRYKPRVADDAICSRALQHHDVS
jgi:hypothetical protein